MMQIETPPSAENAHTDYDSYLTEEQERKANHIYKHRRKAIDDYRMIIEQIKNPKEETKVLQLQLEGA